MIKSFKGKLADYGQVTIRLGTNNGLIGYKIKKFEAVPEKPFEKDQESVLKIFKYKQNAPSDVTSQINFNDETLLGVALHTNSTTPNDKFMFQSTTIFDNVTFNQDIYITHRDQDSAEACNFYLELEQMKLSTDEAAVATLKDMRGTS